MSFERYAKCPVCGKRTALTVPEGVLKRADRFPYLIRVIHEDHYFYIYIDSHALITDILVPEAVE